MIDHRGAEWLTTPEVLERAPRLKAATLRSWIHRGRVRHHRVGRTSWVCWDDVMEVEAAAFRRARRAYKAAAGQGRDRDAT